MGNLNGQILKQQFRVDAFLASGGMGDVYKVYDLHRNVTLAMKVLRADLADDPDMLKRFQREGKALQKLAHPNIVTFYDLHQANGLAFLLEKYIDGPSLSSLLKKSKNRPIPLIDALIYMKAMCAALGFAHANHVVHCDVKPGNVMIDHSGKIFLTDFGIVRHADSDATNLASAGAPAYMAPEQIRGEPVSPATDVYALGVTLFEMLTGQRPFRVSDLGSNYRNNSASEQIIQGHLSIKSPDPRELNPNISTELSLVIQTALSKDPKNRYRDAKSFYKAILAATGYSMEQVPDQVHLIQDMKPVVSKSVIFSPKGIHGKSLQTITRVITKWAWITGSAIIFVLLASRILLNKPSTDKISALFPTKTFTPTSTQVSTRTPGFTSTPLPSATPTSTSTPAPTPEPSFNWFPETLIRGNLSTGYFTSMVIDDQGVIHLVYFQDDYDVLFYSTLHNGQWTAEKVVGGMGSGFHASLALNSQGNPIIAYHIVDYPNNIPRLVMMKWTGSSWQRFQNTQNEAANTDISMAISPDDSLHFSFMDNYSKQVIYSHFLGNQYKNQAIDDAYADCQSFPIVVDQKGYPHLLYQAKEGGLYHATWQGTTWLREQIDPAYGSGYYSALAVDKEGILHIAYYNRDNMKLWYAYQQSNSWETYLVDSNGDVGQYPSIVVDEEGFIHISYYDSTNEDLKYAYGHNDSWSIVTVDSNGNVGLWNSLALDPAGFPYISYLDETNDDLKLAKSFLRLQKP